jgi:hypothetical protein
VILLRPWLFLFLKNFQVTENIIARSIYQKSSEIIALVFTEAAGIASLPGAPRLLDTRMPGKLFRRDTAEWSMLR